MNDTFKKIFRTIQVNFPFLLELKFSVLRKIRNFYSMPFESDFNAISFFPDVAGNLYLDVGANRGQSTDAILMKANHARVELFEPNNILSNRLKRTYSDRTSVHINSFGLGNKVAKTTLYVPFYKKWMFDGLASLNKNEALDWLNGRLYFYRDDDVHLKLMSCEVKKLDDLELSPFFIKIDVQGFEYQVLLGANRTLREFEPVLLIEAPNKVIIDYLEALGYNMYAYKGDQFQFGEKGSLNTYFMTKNKSVMVEDYIVNAA